MHDKQKVNVKASRSNIRVILCCGVEILLVPNVKRMSEAIEAHVEKHRKKVNRLQKVRQKLNEYADDLIMQILNKASKTALIKQIKLKDFKN